MLRKNITEYGTNEEVLKKMGEGDTFKGKETKIFVWPYLHSQQ